jgi:chemotaxis protein CheD
MQPLKSMNNRPNRPPVLPGFESVKAYWDAQHQLYSARILPGEYYVSRGNEIISTVLGSCVSACIRDPDVGIGGMNHFMLPENSNVDPHSTDILNTSARYGSYAMEHMINTILANGGRRERLEIKLFGGGQVLQSSTNVGDRNISFVRNYLRTEALPVQGEDLGGLHPRKVLYFPTTGRVLLRKLPIDKSMEILQVEKSYQHKIEEKPVAGEIDLF